MLWVTWRHHRAQMAACLGLVAAASLALLLLGTTMHAAWTDGPASCLATPGQGDCTGVLAGFQTRFTGSLEQLLGWMNLVPALIGAFLGAPLMGREFETGTWRLAFTQAVPRGRWLTVKVVLLAAAVMTVTALFSLVFGWYRAPLDALEGRFGPNSFDFEGLSLPACTFFAFGAGVLAGVLVRRTLAAMAATIAVYLLVRVPMETWLRPHLQAPVDVTTPAGAASGAGGGDWVLSSGLTSAHGSRLPDDAEAAVLRAAQAAGGPLDSYLHAHGYGHWALIQPASRFWHFQILEAAIYAVLALGCLLAALLALRRQTR